MAEKDFRLQNSDFRLQTSGLQTSNFRLQTSEFGNVILSIWVYTLNTSNGNRELNYILRDYFLFRDTVIWRFWPSRLQTSDFRLQTSDFRLQTSEVRTSDFRLQTSNLELPKLNAFITLPGQFRSVLYSKLVSLIRTNCSGFGRCIIVHFISKLICI